MSRRGGKTGQLSIREEGNQGEHVEIHYIEETEMIFPERRKRESMKYIKTNIAHKGKALLRKEKDTCSILLLAYTPKHSTEKEDRRLIDKLTEVYLKYIDRIGEENSGETGGKEKQ